MKSKYYLTLAAIGVFAYAAQADISNIYGGLSDTDAAEINATAGNLDVVLNPNQTDVSAKAFFKGNGNTISSLKTSGAPAGWNIAGGETTIDINQAGTGSFDAFINGGTMEWASGTAFDFVNSAGASAIANVDVGTLSLANSASSTHGLNFKTNANVLGTSFTASGNSYVVPAISVSNNSNVDYRVSESKFNGSSLISVENGSTLNVYGTIASDNRGIRFKVDGTFNYENTSSINLNASTITGTFSAKSITFIAGTSKLSGEGVINAAGSVYVGSRLTISDNAKVKLTKGTGGRQSQIVIEKSGKLTISAKDAIKYQGGLANILMNGSRNDAELTISADNMFDKLIFSRESNNEFLTLTVNNDARIYFNAISFLYQTTTATLKINNFTEESIFFKDISGWDDLDSVLLSDTEGNTYTKDDLSWVAGTYDGIGGYWLSTVPEPSAYAAIFGVCSIAFVIYRRRK